jgi:anti-sigma factor RsiW
MTDEYDREVSGLVRAFATRHRPGPAFESAVRTELALHSAAARRPAAPGRKPWPGWLLAGCGLALGVFLGVGVMRVADRSGSADALRAELVGSHVRSLQANHLADVASADSHTVKPWYQGKLDYSPPVKDLAAEGFPLLGGRLDYVAGRPVAALIYRRHGHLINVFVWPGTGAERQGLDARQGYNLNHWHAGGMQFWAVSDVNAEELRQLGNLLRQP